MKKTISTLVLSIMMLTSISVQATPKHDHLLSEKRAAIARIMHQGKYTGANIQAENAVLYLPAKETSYSYVEGTWLKDLDYTYTYDAQANMLTFMYGDEYAQVKIAYEYNANNLPVLETESYAEAGAAFENTTQLTKEYDPIVTNFVVASKQYLWDNNAWTMTSRGKTWIKTIERNPQGQVVALTVASYYQDIFDPIIKTQVTYNADGLPDTWTLQELTYDGENLYWEVNTALKNMEWYSTDGQITAIGVDEFFVGNNRLKKADLYEADDVLVGKITATYKENGDYEYAYVYSEPLSKETFSHTITDSYGTYTDEGYYYEDLDGDGQLTVDERLEGFAFTETFDAHRNVVQAQETDIEGVLMGGNQYEYTYQEGTDYPATQIHYEYNPDTEEYEPFIKVEVIEFVNVLSALETISNDRTAAGTQVYSLQGTCLGHTLQGLPAGLYIVRTDAGAKKVLRP